MSQIGLTMFAFGLLFSEVVWKVLDGLWNYEEHRGRYSCGCGIDQSVIGTELYWNNACIEHRKFCDSEKLSVEYLRGEYLARVLECRTFVNGLSTGLTITEY